MRHRLATLLLTVLIGTVFFVPGLRTDRVHILSTAQPPQTAGADLASLQYGLGMIDAAAAWQYSKGAGATLCDVDTGATPTHPDVAGRIIGGINTVDIGSTSWIDDNGHGTHTLGIAAGGGADITGVAPQASLLVAKALDADGSGDSGTVEAAVMYCVLHGAQVINLSLGGSQYEGDGWVRTVKWACSQGVDLAVAAGNDGSGGAGTHPASIRSPCLIAVNAVDKRGLLATWSNYEANSREISAPGVGILSDWPSGGVTLDSGTSMATPFVAGSLLLLRAAGADAPTAVALLRATATRRKDMGFAGGVYSASYGSGIVNVGAAMRLWKAEQG